MTMDIDPRWVFGLFPVMWVAMSWLLARFGGWASLASRFATQAMKAVRYRFTSGTIGRGARSVRYRGSLKVASLPEGLALAVPLPFRLGAPPLLIPWSEVASISEKRRYPDTTFKIRLRGHWATISLQGDVGRAVKSTFEQHGKASAAPAPGGT